jgi:hypothetical protein
MTTRVWQTCVNGLSNKTLIRFAGQVTNAGDLATGGSSRTGAGHISGVNSTLNTGGKTIPVGEVIYLSPIPFTVRNRETGERTYGITIVGQPKDKCYGSTITLPFTELQSFVTGLRSKIDGIMRDLEDSDARDVANCWLDDDLEGIITEDLELSEHIEPLNNYARAYACKQYLRRFQHIQKAHQDVNEKLTGYHDATERTCDRYDTAIASAKFQEKWVSPYCIKGSEKSGANFDDVQDTAADSPVDHHRFVKICYMEDELNHVMESSVKDFQSWMDRFRVGHAMQTSAPGKTLDFLMGF